MNDRSFASAPSRKSSLSRTNVTVQIIYGDGRQETVKKPLGAAHAYVVRFNRYAAETSIDARATIAC